MAQSNGSDPLPADTRIGRIGLRASDRETVTGFYRTVVGLSVLEETDTGTVLGVDDTSLLVLEGAGDRADRRSSEAGLFHTAFRVPSRAALGDALARVRNQWHLDGMADHGVSEALYLSDPEGNGVEIYRDFPREKWPSAPDGGLRMVTEPLDLDPIEAAATGESTASPGTDIGHVHLEVTSPGAFREFAVDGLGFEERTRLPEATFVAAGGYHHHIGANTWNRRTDPVGDAGLSWFEVLVPQSGAIDAIRARIRTSQYRVRETDTGISVTGPDDVEVRVRVED